MRRIKGNIGLFVALLINKVKTVFALKMCNILIISPPCSVIALTSVSEEFHTERCLSAEKTAALCSFQNTDVWFLCKTNLEY